MSYNVLCTKRHTVGDTYTLLTLLRVSARGMFITFYLESRHNPQILPFLRSPPQKKVNNILHTQLSTIDRSPKSHGNHLVAVSWSVCQRWRPTSSSVFSMHAARIVSNTRKYNQGLSHFRRRELHWRDVFDRVRFRMCPGVQVSIQHGAWIPVYTLSTRVQRSWSSSPTLRSSWRTGLSPCQSGYVRGTGVCLFRCTITSL